MRGVAWVSANHRDWVITVDCMWTCQSVQPDCIECELKADDDIASSMAASHDASESNPTADDPRLKDNRKLEVIFRTTEQVVAHADIASLLKSKSSDASR